MYLKFASLVATICLVYSSFLSAADKIFDSWEWINSPVEDFEILDNYDGPFDFKTDRNNIEIEWISLVPSSGFRHGAPARLNIVLNHQSLAFNTRSAYRLKSSPTEGIAVGFKPSDLEYAAPSYKKDETEAYKELSRRFKEEELVYITIDKNIATVVLKSGENKAVTYTFKRY